MCITYTLGTLTLTLFNNLMLNKEAILSWKIYTKINLRLKVKDGKRTE